MNNFPGITENLHKNGYIQPNASVLIQITAIHLNNELCYQRYLFPLSNYFINYDFVVSICTWEASFTFHYTGQEKRTEQFKNAIER